MLTIGPSLQLLCLSNCIVCGLEQDVNNMSGVSVDTADGETAHGWLCFLCIKRLLKGEALCVDE